LREFVALLRKRGEAFDPVSGHDQRVEEVVVAHAEDAALFGEIRADRLVEATGEPGFEDGVVGGDHPAFRQAISGLGEGLLRIDVVFQPDVGVPREQRLRVEGTEYDQVEFLMRRAEKMPSVVEHGAHARVRIRLDAVDLLAQLQNDRIDLDGHDLFGAVVDGDLDVVARSRPEDEDLLGPRAPVMGPVDLIWGAELLENLFDVSARVGGVVAREIDGELVKARIDPHPQAIGLLAVLNVVVGAPMVGVRRVREAHEAQSRDDAQRAQPPTGSEPDDPDHHHEQRPDPGRQLERRAHGEQQGTAQAAGDVPPVGDEPRESVHLVRQERPQGHEGRSGEDEGHDRREQWRDLGRGALRRFVEQPVMDFGRVLEDDQTAGPEHESGDGQQSERQQQIETASALEDHAQSEAEEAGHENQVREVRDDPHFRRDLADQRQLEHQHARRHERDPPRLGSHLPQVFGHPHRRHLTTHGGWNKGRVEHGRCKRCTSQAPEADSVACGRVRDSSHTVGRRPYPRGSNRPSDDRVARPCRSQARLRTSTQAVYTIHTNS
jgi:hypothetical protein